MSELLELLNISLWMDFVFPVSIALLAAATFKAFAIAGARKSAAERRPQMVLPQLKGARRV